MKCKEPGCNASFYDSTARKRHMERAHLGIIYYCQVPGCKSALTRRGIYIRHLKNHKNLNKEQFEEMMKKLKKFGQEINMKGKVKVE